MPQAKEWFDQGEAWAKAHPEVKQQGDFMRGNDLDESVKSIEAKPELVSLMKSEDVTPREFMLARLAALIAVDAPPISYVANASAIQESGMTTEDIQGVMIAVAPVVGAPRVMSAGGHILRALGIAVAVAESEMDDESSLR